jgi:hypothetical protein
VHPSQVVGTAACFKSYDLHTVTLEELKAPLRVGWCAGRAHWCLQHAQSPPQTSAAVCHANGWLLPFHSLTHPCAALPVLQASFSMRILEDGPVDAFCGWFDTQFKGSAENPTTTEVILSTAPDPTGATHWGQQVTPCTRVLTRQASSSLLS